MKPAALKPFFAKPALLIAAGLVLLGATAGRASPPSEGPSLDAERSCRTTRPSIDTLCRCLTAALASDDDTGFAHVGLDVAFEPQAGSVSASGPIPARVLDVCSGPPRLRLRQCPIGPSPPR